MTTPRDPTDTYEYLDKSIKASERRVLEIIREIEDHPDIPHRYFILSTPRSMAKSLFNRYSRGDAMEELHRHLHEEYIPTFRRAERLSQEHFPDQPYRMHLENKDGWMLFALLACLDDDGSLLANPSRWFSHCGKTPLYAMVLGGLSPNYHYDGDYDAKSNALAGDDQLVELLRQPAETWQQGCLNFMHRWPKTMKAHGYRDYFDAAKGARPAYPTSLAMVVCAFDIDDSGFRHLPFYPMDIVDYYRAHRRPGRAPWQDPVRAIPEHAFPRPKKIYPLRSSEAYSRWIEIISNGSPERCRKVLGRRKTMPDLFTVTEALVNVGLAICADWKDDETMEAQAKDMYMAWGHPWPVDGASTLQGAARVSELLNALDAATGPRLAVITDESDTVMAVLIDADREAEFTELCEQLEVRRLYRQDWQ